MQLASMAHASEVSVGGALEYNLSNWMSRLHQIKKMREKYRSHDDTHQNDNGGSGTGRAGRNSNTEVSTNLSDFTSYS